MKISVNKLQGLVYFEEGNVFGYVKDVDVLERSVTINTGEIEMELHLDEVEFLPLIGTFNGVVVVDGDVFKAVNNNGDELYYQINLQKDEINVVFHLLDENLEKLESGEEFDKSLLESIFCEALEHVGNIHEIKNENLQEEVDFNIKVVKDGHNIYYYACNNTVEETVDLIKVVFIGANLLEEEYSRTTVDYDEYLEYIATGFVTEVSTQELQEYAYGVMSGKVQHSSGTFTGTLSSDKGLIVTGDNGSMVVTGGTISGVKKIKCFSDCDDLCNECTFYSEDEEVEEDECLCINCLNKIEDKWQ